MENEKLQLKMNAVIGTLYLVASRGAVLGVYWKKQSVEMGTSPLLSRVEKEIEEFLSGKRKKFSFPFEMEGTEFQKSVWKELLKIPYGKTLSYREIAKKIGNPKAVRAVGTANGRNPLCIVVPCHRVIAADGTLGGYSGGLKVKTFLLELEKD